MDPKKFLTVLIIIIVVALLGFALWKFWGSSAEVSSGLATADSNSSTAYGEVSGQDNIEDFNALANLNMDTAFFSNPDGVDPLGDPVFRSLVDRHQIPADEPVGRDNPFLPIDKEWFSRRI